MSFSVLVSLATVTIHPLVLVASQLLLAVSFILALIRLFKGPDVTDRVVALDLIAGILLAFTLFHAINQDEMNFMNISLDIAVIVFLGTVAIARYLELRAVTKELALKEATSCERKSR